MRVSVEEIRELKRRLKEINSIQFDEIIFTENGKDLIIPINIRNDFEFTGLANTDFIDYFEIKSSPNL